MESAILPEWKFISENHLVNDIIAFGKKRIERIGNQHNIKALEQYGGGELIAMPNRLT